jgi:2-oxoglutarate dehydrogenase E2 component (dihydrolipoamide succinyltransferase)
MATEVLMPQLGESVFEGTIAVWLKKEGDTVDLYEPILEIETDKVTTEATAEVAGTLLKILVAEGETVEVGTVLAYLGKPGEKIDGLTGSKSESAVVEEKAPAPAPAAVKSKTAAPVTKRPASNGGPVQAPKRYTGRVSPVVGRIAEQHEVNLDLVTATGRDGRITKKDILAFVEEQDQAPTAAPVREQTAPATKPAPTPTPSPASVPVPSAAPVGLSAEPGELLPMTNIRRSIAEHMVRSKHTSPHVTTVFEIDFTAVAEHRAANKQVFARDGANLTFTAYIVAAIVKALKHHPLVNSSWDEKGIRLHKAINVGMAAAIEEG